MNGLFLTDDPTCRPRTDGVECWTFTSTVGFRDEFGKEWWTSAPFVSDGASIPAPLRILYGHPFRSDFIRPAALHDWYYQHWANSFGCNKLGNMARKFVDRMFYSALLVDGVLPIKAYTMYLGVRVGGWLPWRRYALVSNQ